MSKTLVEVFKEQDEELRETCEFLTGLLQKYVDRYGRDIIDKEVFKR